MNQVLVAFEESVGLPPKQACLLLGIAYVTYAHYRSGLRPLPPYHVRHIATIGLLNQRQLKTLIEDVTNGRADD